MKNKTALRWLFTGGLLGYFVLHPLIMITAYFMFESKSDHGYTMPDIIIDEALMSFSFKMLPWSFSFAIFGAFIGFSYGKIKQMEKALRESEERFRNLATAAKDAIIMMDSKGNILYWNPAAEKIFGYKEEEVYEKDLHKLIVPEKFYENHLKGFRTFKKTGGGFFIGKILELSALRKDGTEIPVELSLSSLKLQGEFHAVGIIRDISERKLAEKERLQKEKLQGVLEMAGAACHELNQPLQVILIYSKLLLKNIPESNPLHADVKTISEQTDKMVVIMKKIMRITKYETCDYIRDIKIIDIDKASKP